LQELKPGLSGVTIDAGIFRPAAFIAQSIDNVSWALLARLRFSLIVVLLAFLYEWRVAMISLVAIPLSLVHRGSQCSTSAARP
jgi:Cu/Ag efflux pump CusA